MPADENTVDVRPVEVVEHELRAAESDPTPGISFSY